MIRMKDKSSAPFASTLRLEPNPSRYLARALMLVYGSSAMFLVLFSGSLLVAVAVLCLLCLALLAGYPARTRVRRVIRKAVWHADGTWHVEGADGARSFARLLPSTFFHSLLVVLHFRVEGGGRRYMVLCRDSLGPEQFRRLRARMRVDGPDS